MWVTKCGDQGSEGRNCNTRKKKEGGEGKSKALGIALMVGFVV